MGNDAPVRNYWEKFYLGEDWSKLTSPSDFSKFIVNFIEKEKIVFDFACGTGRDAVFFSENGFKVTCFDLSSEAIKKIDALALPGLRAVNGSVGSLDIAFENLATDYPFSRVVLYARFFLHAVDKKTESEFLEVISKHRNKLSKVCLEYRTLGDAINSKFFGSHYRRYVDHRKLCEELKILDFKILYEYEGLGLSSFQSENPTLGRLIVSPNE